VIWRKPLAFAADAGSYIYIVWGFNGRFAISSPSALLIANFCSNLTCCTDAYYHLAGEILPQLLTALTALTAASRTRDSVRRDSGFVRISITLIFPVTGNLSSKGLIPPVSYPVQVQKVLL
jgi:hypothetical protein